MMFGLPGAGLAIYRAAKPENKARVASLMMAASFASFFTGVTEPLEFSFMFVAPQLYVLHAFLTGISVFVAAQMHWIAGFGFSAGLVDLALSARNPLAVDWYLLIVQGQVFFAIYYFSFALVIRALRLKTPGREDGEAGASPAEVKASISPAGGSEIENLALAYLEVIGGASNVSDIDACISRLRLTLKDSAKVDEAAAKRVGASGVIRLNSQNVQIVIGTQAELVAAAMKKLLGNDGARS